ncbi:mRNA-degrading endonuclease RelE of RelBE toxin-antitoxin system [Runella defluvii]|uniref:mRNA-degrading endonuclease RelE of RelBE toxin-antitoxin system n=1 Tax=Runella defluvii TaxID=370973 RepID=A0A7W6EPI0_9BACT|nr:type II toxin-antitoxin system RelE/ParE family toxin [Runella defluvii]MBB3837392.1 mRNA-degrading endonuclease RelE of RelBE toxin-antitoxin system [Runella defluvii]
MNELLITFTPEFRREYKQLSKKYRSLDADMQGLIAKLQENPTLGTSLGNNAYKIRLAITSKNKGKSGGARVITYYISDDTELYLLSIYDKSEQEKISDNDIKILIHKALGDK